MIQGIGKVVTLQQLWAGNIEDVGDRYLCKHPSPWYTQEKRPPSPFLCTYMGRQDSGRGRPFDLS